jgi:hypothetical protein
MYNPATDSMEYDLPTQLDNLISEHHVIITTRLPRTMLAVERYVSGEYEANEDAQDYLVRELAYWQRRITALVAAMFAIKRTIAAGREGDQALTDAYAAIKASHIRL